MDGASLGFSLINRPAAGCCVFSTSLLGQDDVHGTKGLGMAGRQAGVRATAHVHYWVYKKYLATIQRPMHPSITRTVQRRMVRGTVYVLYWPACAIMSSTNHDGLTCVYCIRGGLASSLLLSPLSSSSMGQACSTFTCMCWSISSARNKRRTYCRDINYK
jgi:hypothetical protein